MSGLDTRQSGTESARPKAARDGGRRIGDIWQRLGTSGALSGTDGTGWRAFLYTFAAVAVIVGTIDIVSVITIVHERPQQGLAGPIVWEGSSWVTWLAFTWIAWIAFRLAPPLGGARWRVLAVHPIGAVLFSLAHVAGFVALRKLVYWLAGTAYDYGAFWPHFAYEFGKDVFGYALMIAAFALNEHLLLLYARTAPALYTIRDGARITRVAFSDILAVASAGNYVEFVLRDGRKLLMRSPLGALEAELAPRGFVRVHRSWLVNAMQMTGLEPEGSGDYTVALGNLQVPLSRRFPEALAKLRAA
ncbi:MAG: LytTR family DNA-binding domain-containing protein [Rhizomicrobium sp.]